MPRAKSWLRQDRTDFFQRELQHIGQQSVFEEEIYADGTNQGTVFGYSDRYQEYRYQRSRVAGEFRPGEPLDYWHLGRQFASAPTLNASFVQCVPSKRIFNEQTQDSLWIAVSHQLRASRRIVRTANPRIF